MLKFGEVEIMPSAHPRTGVLSVLTCTRIGARMGLAVHLSITMLSGCRFVGLCLDEKQCEANDPKPVSPTSNDPNQKERCKDAVLLGSWVNPKDLKHEVVFRKDCTFTYSRCALQGEYNPSKKLRAEEAFKFEAIPNGVPATGCARPNTQKPIVCAWDVYETRETQGITLNASLSCDGEKQGEVIDLFEDFREK